MVFKKIIFQNRYVALEAPSRPPPPFMAKTILNFHFDYWNPSLRVQIDMNVFGVFHLNISESEAAHFGDLMKYVTNQNHSAFVRNFQNCCTFCIFLKKDLQNSALQWGTLQELQYFKNDLSLVHV